MLVRNGFFLAAISAAVFFSGTVGVGQPATVGEGQSAGAEQVRSELAKLKRWLGNDATATAWHEYLRTADLERELAAGPNADEVTVHGVLRRYASGQPGLEVARFDGVRGALKAWHGSLRPVGPDQFVSLVDAARKEIVPADKSDTAAARADLDKAAGNLVAGLRSTAERQWSQEAGLVDLQRQAAAEKPDLAALSKFADRFAQETAQAERREFRLLRRALDRYLALAAYASDEKSNERTTAALDTLAADLPAYAESRDSEAGRRVGRALGYLQRHGQAPRLVAAVRRHYAQPNLYVDVSRAVLAPAFEGPIDQIAPVRQNILGTDIHGTGHTIGQADFNLIPASDRATFEMAMRANTRTRTVGYNGPVTIYSSGVTQISATKRIYFTLDGLVALPAKAQADVNNTINGISARCGIGGRLVEKIAWRRAGEQSGQAEAIASDIAAERASVEFDEQGGKRITEANDKLRDKFRVPLVQRDEVPMVTTKTTDGTLSLVALQVNRDQLGAPSPPPDVVGTSALSVRAHETAAVNFASASLAGETIDRERVEKYYRENDQPVPENLQRKEDEPPWSMTFARVDPVTLALDNNTVRITLRGQRYTSGDRAFQAMNITAVYKVERTDAGVNLIREGDLDISPPNHKPGQQLNASQIALRRLLSRRFGGLFKAEIVGEGLELPGKLKAHGKMKLVDLAIDDGWAKLAWKLNEPAAKTPAQGASVKVRSADVSR